MSHSQNASPKRKQPLLHKNPRRLLGGDKLFYKVSNYLLSLIAACPAIGKKGNEYYY